MHVVGFSMNEPSCVYAFSDSGLAIAIVSTYTSCLCIVRGGDIASKVSISCPGLAIANSIIELRMDSTLYILTGISLLV